MPPSSLRAAYARAMSSPVLTQAGLVAVSARAMRSPVLRNGLLGVPQAQEAMKDPKIQMIMQVT
eukprot:1991372-Rhodomonas_salina.2